MTSDGGTIDNIDIVYFIYSVYRLNGCHGMVAHSSGITKICPVFYTSIKHARLSVNPSLTVIALQQFRMKSFLQIFASEGDDPFSFRYVHEPLLQTQNQET